MATVAPRAALRQRGPNCGEVVALEPREGRKETRRLVARNLAARDNWCQSEARHVLTPLVTTEKPEESSQNVLREDPAPSDARVVGASPSACEADALMIRVVKDDGSVEERAFQFLSTWEAQTWSSMSESPTPDSVPSSVNETGRENKAVELLRPLGGGSCKESEAFTRGESAAWDSSSGSLLDIDIDIEEKIRSWFVEDDRDKDSVKSQLYPSERASLASGQGPGSATPSTSCSGSDHNVSGTWCVRDEIVPAGLWDLECVESSPVRPGWKEATPKQKQRVFIMESANSDDRDSSATESPSTPKALKNAALGARSLSCNSQNQGERWRFMPLSPGPLQLVDRATLVRLSSGFGLVVNAGDLKTNMTPHELARLRAPFPIRAEAIEILHRKKALPPLDF
ncbi:hypothetical protein FVE85_6706 [Porphyridium purpureum]|uniref:Uncharacterized protein n=1 Tax=Porphyridium purpureum TaxID=35688 RepID=A0A5J4Z5J0_PORPP|nr:hypothetical protein FVE85_6706 [Porphyridium purpureum]|eukprot:POR2852..scf295_1